MAFVNLRSTFSFAQNLPDGEDDSYASAMLVGDEGWPVRYPFPLLLATSPLIARAVEGTCSCREVLIHLPGFSSAIIELFVKFVSGQIVKGSFDQLDPLCDLCGLLEVPVKLDSQMSFCMNGQDNIEPRPVSCYNSNRQASVPNSVKCGVCKRVFREDALLSHMTLHLGKRKKNSSMKTSCQIVLDDARNSKALSVYVKKPPPLQSPPADCPTQTETTNMKHGRNDSRLNGSKTFLCKTCGKSFSCHHNLLLHSTYHYQTTATQRFGNHSASWSLKCTTCKKFFKSYRKMAKHMYKHTLAEKQVNVTNALEALTI